MWFLDKERSWKSGRKEKFALYQVLYVESSYVLVSVVAADLHHSCVSLSASQKWLHLVYLATSVSVPSSAS